MLRSCLTCGRPFGEGRLPELPRGTRVAYGPDKGRLWQICERCGAWSLVPIEARWEALEALEREVRDRGRALASTEHVTLLRAGDLDITRVGPAPRVEEAWWRFGERLRARRSRYRRLARANTFLSFLVMPDVTLFSLSMNRDRELADRAPRLLQSIARRTAFGRLAWRGGLACGTCGRVRERLTFARAESMRLVTAPDGAPALVWECDRCRGERWWWAGSRDRVGTATAEEAASLPAEATSLPAEATESLLRRFLKRANFRGASEPQIEAAAAAIDGAGEPAALIDSLAGRRAPLSDLDPEEAVGLEMALNEASETRWLELDAAEAERQWRRAEELAAIIDGELAP
jgi:hypothetical protein